MPDKPACFIIMPISDPKDYHPGHFGVVYQNFIKPACEQAGFRAIRADDVNETNYIAVDILRKIVDADMAICDLSSRNPNVLYELGLRHAVGKPVSLIKDNETDWIFDIQGIRHIEYDAGLRIDKIQSSINLLADNIRTTYDARTNSSSSLMSLLQSGDTHATATHDTASRTSGPTRSEDAEFLNGNVVHWDETRRIGVISAAEQSYY